MTVTVSRVGPEAAPILRNLFQLYVHDFSEFWAGLPPGKGDVGADGRYADFPLDDYWRRPGWSAHLIRRADTLAGFALLNDQAHAGAPVAHSVAEFFVLRKYRRFGVGLAAAQRLLGLHAGTWEVAVVRANAGAAAFWRRAIRATPGVSGLIEHDIDDARWTGPLMRFQRG